MVLPSEARQWWNDTSVRVSLEQPRTLSVRLVGVRILLEKSSDFVQDTQHIIILYHFEGYTMREIGKALKISSSLVSQLYCSALATIKANPVLRELVFAR